MRRRPGRPGPRVPSAAMALFPIRTFGDPVLRQPAREVTDFDADLRRLADDMLETMYDAPGVGPGRPPDRHPEADVRLRHRRRGGRGIVVNPALTEPRRASGSTTEGCLSVPDLHWPILRPDRVRLTGFDVDGKPLSHRGRRAAWPACSSTRSTTSTASCCSSGSTRSSASRPCGPCASAPRASPARRLRRGDGHPAARLPGHARGGRRPAAGPRRRRPRRRPGGQPARPPPGTGRRRSCPAR